MIGNSNLKRNLIEGLSYIALLIMISVFVYFLFSEKIEYMLGDRKVLSGKILFMISLLVWGPTTWLCIKIVEFFFGKNDG